MEDAWFGVVTKKRMRDCWCGGRKDEGVEGVFI